jgi:hypothetical protein
MMHLSLDRISFANEAAISFMKTVIQAPSLTRLDISSCILVDGVSESLASWCNSNHEKSMIQTLHVSGGAILHDGGMQHFVKVLQLHFPHLKSLFLYKFDFCYDSAVYWAKALQTVPLEK